MPRNDAPRARRSAGRAQLRYHADEVALREARGESGLEVRALDEAIFEIDVHLIPARNSEPAHYHYDVRFPVQATEDRFRVSEESRALAWVLAIWARGRRMRGGELLASG